MISIHQFIILVNITSTLVSGIKKVRIYNNNPFYIYISIIYLFSELITQFFIAYKFPILLVSWLLFTDPLFQEIIKYLYKNKKLIK